jgi:hypothetical protein
MGTFNTFEHTDVDSSLLRASSNILRSASDLVFPGTRSAEGEDEYPVGFKSFGRLLVHRRLAEILQQ